MPSPFSRIAARSRLSWSSRKSSRSEACEVSVGETAIFEHCAGGDLIEEMEMHTSKGYLFSSLARKHALFDADASSLALESPDIAKSMSPIIATSISLGLPNYSKPRIVRKSISTISSAGSLFSESPSFDEKLKEPTTPTFPDWSSSTALPDDADSLLLGDRAQPKIHRAFSFERVPEAPLRPAPLPPITRNETAAIFVLESTNTPSCPIDSTALDSLECHATIIPPIDDFMQHIPTIYTTLTEKKTWFPLRKIDTLNLHIRRNSQLDVTATKPLDHDAEMLSLGYKAYSASKTEQDRALLSFSEREIQSSRHSIANPIPKKNSAYDEYRKGTTRYSIQTPSRRLLNDMQEQELFMTPQYKPYSAPQHTLRRSPAGNELHVDTEQKGVARFSCPAPVRYVPYSAPEIKRKPVPSKLETFSEPTELFIPEDIPAPLFSKPTEPVIVAKPRNLFMTGDFAAKDQGLQLKMTRIVTTFSKLEWVIQDLSGSRRLKCFAPSNSFSNKKDFMDSESNPLFTFQKRIGNTRIATTPLGAEVFSIHNASLPSIAQWTVKLGISDTGAAVQWDAKDRGTETVVVRQAGVEVGRIKRESGTRSHCYIVSIARGQNFVVMAALATVFDDLRTDEGW